MNVADRNLRDLGPMLRPRSVAVIGASEQPGNLGGVAIDLMKKFGYRGGILPVNPGRATVHGVTCFPSVAALPVRPDLAVIAIGAERAAGVVRECAAAGIRHGIIWAGGFAETGEDGKKLQDELIDICRETGFTVAGPNCLGVINTQSAMVATFASFLLESDTLNPGNIAMISQSGGQATMAMALAQRRGMGFGLTVSTGNEAMLTVADYIEAVAADDTIKVIAAYIEGVRDGGHFVRAVSAARAAGKQVVVLKGGLTAASALAAAAHTGALAGEGRVWEAMARELGIITVTSLAELLDISLYLSRLDLACLPKGNRAAVISFGGGGAVLAADQCAANGLEIPPLQPDTIARLAPLVTPIASIRNPVDVTPQTFNSEKWFALFPSALDTIAADPGIDILLCLFGPQAQRGAETAKIVSELRQRTQKTVCLAWQLAPRGIPEILAQDGVYVFEEYAYAIAAMGKLARGAEEPSAPRPPAATSGFDWKAFVPAPYPGQVISEHDCHRILSQAGVATARGALVHSAKEAVAAAAGFGFPVVAKGISGAVTHRAAAGLVLLDIRNDADLRDAYRTLSSRAEAAGTPLEGVYVQEMIKKGVEIIVSAFRDPIFGKMVSCGWGGNLTEIMDDVVLARSPLDEAGAARMLQRLRIVAAAGKMEPDADIADLARFVAHFSQVAHAAPWENYVIEINPVKWSARGVTAIDGLLIIQAP